MPEHASAPEPIELMIESAKAGRREAVGELIERYLPEIRAYVRLNVGAVVRARESCSDLVQTVCKDVLRHLGSFEYRGEGSFKGWLYVAVLNKIRSRERHYQADKRNIRHEVPPDEDGRLTGVYATICSPTRHAASREQLARVEAAFERLPADYREVISLKRIAGMSIAETAEQMQRTPGAVKVLLHRATARLVSLLDTD